MSKGLTPQFDPGDLEGLFLSCHRNKRPARFPVKEIKYFSDAERFRWWFNHGQRNEELYVQMAAHSLGWPIAKLRDWLDTEMRKHPEQT